MRGINKVILLGTAGNKAPSDGGVLLTLSSTRTFLDSMGERQEEIEHHRILFRGRLSHIVGEYIERGRYLYVEGRLQSTTQTLPDGTEYTDTVVLADTVQLLSDGKKGTHARPSPPA